MGRIERTSLETPVGDPAVGVVHHRWDIGADRCGRIHAEDRMRHTEFWIRLDQALGRDYSRSWAGMFVMADLGSRTVEEALAAGMAPKQVWAAVWKVLELPERDR